MDEAKPLPTLPPSARAVRRANSLLIAVYGQRTPLPREPLEGLILIILSQATSDVNCDKAFTSLRARFATWEQVMRAPLAEVVAAIACGGLANQKAARIQAILRAIYDDTGELDLGWMREASAAECIAYLQKFHGIGPKTIACMLLFFLDKPAFPVDTHVHRIARRLGWVGARTSAEEAHRILEKAVPDNCKLDLHINLISHGRAVCRAQGNGGPQCARCVLRRSCAYGKLVRLGSGARAAAKATEVANNGFHGTDFFVTMQGKP